MTPALLATCAGGMLLDFGDDSIRALLDGRKTETRTVVNMRGIEFVGGRGMEDDQSGWGYFAEVPHEFNRWHVLAQGLDERHNNGRVSLPPRYQPGKLYYVREAWCTEVTADGLWTGGWIYRADEGEDFHPWKSPVRMSRASARYVVEVTDTRVERVQEITEEGAFLEGCDGPHATCIGGDICEVGPASPVGDFIERWDARHKRAPWSSNPWVEVSTIRVVTE